MPTPPAASDQPVYPTASDVAGSQSLASPPPPTPPTDKKKKKSDGMDRAGTVSLDPKTQQVEQRVYLKWIMSELETENSCLELPFTIILLVAFSFLAIMHLNQQRIFSVEVAIESDILENANFAWSHAFGHKGLVDVHSFADFWSWTRLGFIPLVIQPSWAYSEDYSSASGSRFKAVGKKAVDPPSKFTLSGGGVLPVHGDYMRYNRIIGGIRFRQILSNAGTASGDLCRFPSSAPSEVWKKWYGKPCFPAGNAQELAFLPDTTDSEAFGTDVQRVEWMLLSDPLEKMMAQMVDMEDGCEQMEAKGNRTCLCQWCAKESPPQPWLTERTARLEIGMVSYNPEYGLITLTGVNLFFNRGSFMHKRVELMSSWIDLWSTPIMELAMMLFFDFIWVVSLLKVVVGELKEIWAISRKAGIWRCRCLKVLYTDYLGAWNFVDWVSIAAATQIIVNFLTLQARQIVLNAEFRGIIEPDPAYSHTSEEIGVFFKSLEEVCNQERAFRTSLCFYPMIVMLRLFKSFAAQPRLAVVTETIAHGSQDLLHFFIIFLSVFSCLCLNAVLLFGQDLEEFGTFFRALHSGFRLMFGDWDWKAMEKVSRVTAGIWFWIFMLMIVMVMFNVLLAIVMESYITVKKTAQNASSLFQTMAEMRRRRSQYKAGKRVRLNDILDGIKKEQKAAGLTDDEMLESERLLDPRMVMTMVDGLAMTQATRTLANAQKAHDKELEAPLELSEAHDRLLELNYQNAVVRDSLFEAYAIVDKYDTISNLEEGHKAELAALSEAQTTAIRADLAMASATAKESPVNNQVLDTVTSEVGRLTAEVASVLAQTMKRVDKKQNHLESRQKEMLGSIREMQTKLQMVQSEASGLTTRIQRYTHKQVKEPRRGIAGAVVPSCLIPCSSKGLPPQSGSS